MSFKKKSTYIVLAALVIVLVSIVSIAAGSSGSDLANRTLSPAFAPLRRAMTTVVDGFERVYNLAYRYDRLVEENEELKARVARLEDDYREYSEISEENERLHKLLGFATKHTDYTLTSATIISWTSSNWASSFTVNLDGETEVSPGDSVITETGYLVGRVTSVSSMSATVTTIIDTTMNIGALVYETGETAVAEGDFDAFQDGQMRLSYIQNIEGVMTGCTVVTSGKGGAYPKGLVIGTVSEVVTPASGLGVYARINPSADIDNLSHVYIITEFEVSD